mmetsp:Transcript_116/g.172  ORF Transcript_116/g.172 Transcript_116/m.172 type:complete len:263 (-) Transcript_116:458-1246(-)
MSSRSAWNSSWMSCTSLVAVWYFVHNFFSLFVLSSTSSWSELYCSSRRRRSSSFSASSCASSCSRSARSSRASLARRSWASCLAALSIISPPTISFCFIWFILATSACFCASIFSRCSCSAFSRSSRALRSSAVFEWSSSSFFISSAAFFFRRCFSASASPRSRASSSSVAPLFTSRMTSFSTIFSMTCAPTGTCTSWPSMTIVLGTPPPPAPPAASSCAFSRLISSWNSRSMASLGSSLILGLFLMFFARFAYLRVVTVSS